MLYDAFLAGRLLDASRVSWRHCSWFFECCVSSSSFSCWQVISPTCPAGRGKRLEGTAMWNGRDANQATEKGEQLHKARAHQHFLWIRGWLKMGMIPTNPHIAIWIEEMMIIHCNLYINLLPPFDHFSHYHLEKKHQVLIGKSSTLW